MIYLNVTWRLKDTLSKIDHTYLILENLLSKKKAALNAIGLWYKYYSYESKMFPSHRHVHWDAESGIRNGRKVNEFSVKSLKLSRLKTKMYKGIIYWRALRNSKFIIGYVHPIKNI